MRWALSILYLCVFLSVIGGCKKDPAGDAEIEILLDEHFDDNRAGWWEADEYDYEIFIEDGFYIFYTYNTLDERDYYYGELSRPIVDGLAGTVTIETAIRLDYVSTGDEASFGISDLDTGEEMYVLFIDHQSRYSIQKYLYGEREGEMDIPWTYEAAIKTSGWNILKLVKHPDNSLEYFVNDKLIVTGTIEKPFVSVAKSAS